MASRHHVGVFLTVCVLSFGCGGEAQKGDQMVDIFKDGAMQRIELKKLNKKLPVEQSRTTPGDIHGADAIVGWYDNGHNYHKERMDGKAIGDVVSNPAEQKGISLSDKVQIFRKDKTIAEMVAFEAISSPGADKADVIGWYDSGHSFHKEKMDGKALDGGAVINPGAEKGNVIDPAVAGQKAIEAPAGP